MQDIFRIFTRVALSGVWRPFASIPRSRNREAIEQLIRTIRSPCDDVFSQNEFVELEGTVISSNSRELFDAYVDRFGELVPSLSTDDVLRICESLAKRMNSARPQEARARLCRILESMVSHGSSSFSLDAVLRYFELCGRLRVVPDQLFSRSLFQRVLMVNPIDSEDKSDYASYLIQLFGVSRDSFIFDRIKLIERDTLQAISLKDIDALLTISRSSEGDSRTDDDSTSDDFHSLISQVAEKAVGSRSLDQLLEQTDKLRSHSPLFSRALDSMGERLSTDPALSAQQASLVLKSLGRSSESVTAVSHLINSVATEAFSDRNNLRDNMRSLANMYGARLVPDELKAIVSNAVLDLPVDGFATEESVEGFVSAVHSLMILDMQDPALIGKVVATIDQIRKNGFLLPSFWKLSAWYQLSVHALPFDSIIPEILHTEYPETVEALRNCTLDKFVQPQPPASWYASVMQGLTTKLRTEGIPFTQYPKISETPLRVHFMVRLDGQQPVYVVLSRDGNILPVCKGSRVSSKTYQRLGKMAGIQIHEVPLEDLILEDSPSLTTYLSRLVDH